MTTATRNDLGFCSEGKCRERLHIHGVDVQCTRGHIQRDHPLAQELREYRQKASNSSGPPIALEGLAPSPMGAGWRLDMTQSLLSSEHGPAVLRCLSSPEANAAAMETAV